MYGVETYVEECLRSIADQSFADFEVIMVDDASPDGSGAIAQAFAAEDPRFHYVHQEARGPGPGGGRNGGLPFATGEWIIFIDADDVIEPLMLERMVDAGQEIEADLVTCNTVRLVGSSIRRSEFHDLSHPCDVKRTTAAESPWLMLDSTPWNKLFKRSFFDTAVGEWPEKVLYEDIAAMTRAHLASSATAVVAEDFYLWRIRVDGGSITQETSTIRGDLAQIRELRAAHQSILDTGNQELADWFAWKAYSFDLHWMTRKIRHCSSEDARSLATAMAGAIDQLGERTITLLRPNSQACFRWIREAEERKWALGTRLYEGRLFADGRALDVARASRDPEAVLLNASATGTKLRLTVSLPDNPRSDGWTLEFGPRMLVGSACPPVSGTVVGVELASMRPGRQVVDFDIDVRSLPDEPIAHLAVRHSDAAMFGTIGRSFQDRLRSRIGGERAATANNRSVFPFFDNSRLTLAINCLSTSIVSTDWGENQITFSVSPTTEAAISELALFGVHQHQPIALSKRSAISWSIDIDEVVKAHIAGSELLFVASLEPKRAIPRPVTGIDPAQGRRSHGDRTIDVLVATQGQLAIRTLAQGRKRIRAVVRDLRDRGHIPGL